MKRLAYTLPVVILLVILFMYWPAKTVNLPPEANLPAGPFSNPPVDRMIVKAGETFLIRLRSNPTTGYQWALARPLDEKVIQLSGNKYEPEETGLVGSGGTEMWTFRALRKGTAAVSFKYMRPWEKAVAPAEEKFFEITVRPE